MPLFAYECPSCEATFEVLVGPGRRAEDKIECTACGREGAVRQFGAPAKIGSDASLTNCRGDGPPCGAVSCGRRRP